MRVLTFSQTFPSYHPKRGERTRFVEKIWRSLSDMGEVDNNIPNYMLCESLYSLHYPIEFVPEERIQFHTPKHHTIREGQRWKEGDWFRPVVWGTDVNQKSGRSGPYHSKQVQFAPPVQVKSALKFQISVDVIFGALEVHINNDYICTVGSDRWDEIAANDGLSGEDFTSWLFPKKYKKGQVLFDGQIICWNENINY